MATQRRNMLNNLSQNGTLTALFEARRMNVEPNQFLAENEILQAVISRSGVARSGVIGAEQPKERRKAKQKRQQRDLNATVQNLAHLHEELEQVNKDLNEAKKLKDAAIQNQLDKNAITQDETGSIFKTLDKLERVTDKIEQAGFITLKDNKGDRHVVFKSDEGQYFTLESDRAIEITAQDQLQDIKNQEQNAGKRCASEYDMYHNPLIEKQEALFKDLENYENKAHDAYLNEQSAQEFSQIVYIEVDRLVADKEALQNDISEIESILADNDEASASSGSDSENEGSDVHAPAPNKDLMLYGDKKTKITAILEKHGDNISDKELKKILKKHGISMKPSTLNHIKRDLVENFGFKFENKNPLPLPNNNAVTLNTSPTNAPGPTFTS